MGITVLLRMCVRRAYPTMPIPIGKEQIGITHGFSPSSEDIVASSDAFIITKTGEIAHRVENAVRSVPVNRAKSNARAGIRIGLLIKNRPVPTKITSQSTPASRNRMMAEADGGGLWVHLTSAA